MNANAPAKYTVNCSILLADTPIFERPRAAREAGFEAVEFWWPFPTAVPSDRQVDAFVAAIEDAGVQLTGLNFAAGDMPGGERGILSDPTRVTEFRDNIDVVVGIGERLGTPAFNALYGNRIDGVDPAEQDAVAAENLAAAGRAAAGIGAVVLIEPVSGAPRYPLLTAADAVTVIDRVREQSGVDSLRLLADLYHLQVNGDDVAAAIDTHAGLIGHVQIADDPGRGEPGTGTLDLDGHLAHLERVGYRGPIGLEYKQTQDDPFAWLPRERRAARVASAS
ncbi:hydroxypyruvate isomerase family protein [Tsukamurella ocularis]|uniref:hydroxypyruvate isomerase family protein n=1 Tax=Tsukamurella ocularis TaxID=1970234 RepID=UPI00216A9FAF|nr:TIM barrel protein [Tsukamurella ocularis]MCS3780569.1 hydroxypyruvate isomerase [Tsukamurella ocularis]MCS3785876.1 hydroxypyruvate isomerase [Tsukamurella ocularis]MCS3849240.1 hydroxypyruvate isomerase [Tsukamurella ocularis]